MSKAPKKEYIELSGFSSGSDESLFNAKTQTTKLDSSSEESLFTRPSTSGTTTRRRNFGAGKPKIRVNSDDLLSQFVAHNYPTGSDESLFDIRTEIPNIQRSKVHKGIGAAKVPIKSVGGAKFAGQEHMDVFAGHLGAAAADVNSPLNKALDNLFYGERKPSEEYDKEFLTKLIRDGVITKNQADIEYGYHLMKDIPEIPKKNVNNTTTTTEQTGHSGYLENYPHVGPGNKILNKAKNVIDNIARTHDIAYGTAKTPTDVLKADEEFIKDMGKVEPKTWGETAVKHISKLGIQAKKNIEQITGHVFYPSEVNNYASNGELIFTFCTRRAKSHGTTVKDATT